MSWKSAAAAVAAMGTVCAAFSAWGENAGASARAPALHPVAGLIEYAIVYPGGFRLKAKLDTGARTSSLDVDRYRVFTKDGRRMIEFTTDLDGDKPLTMTLPLARMARIKRRGGGVTTRPVVMLDICLGKVLKRTEVNLLDRSNFLYPLLIGRRYLIGSYLVDPGRNHLQAPDCPVPKPAPKDAGR